MFVMVLDCQFYVQYPQIISRIIGNPASAALSFSGFY